MPLELLLCLSFSRLLRLASFGLPSWLQESREAERVMDGGSVEGFSVRVADTAHTFRAC